GVRSRPPAFLRRPVSALPAGRSPCEPAGRPACDIHGQSRLVRKEGGPMTNHTVATRQEWQAAPRGMLTEGKELTRRRDPRAAGRRALPWVPIEKEYRFGTAEGPKTLPELFDGRSQLIVYHFMFGPDYTAGCPACSSGADSFNGADLYLTYSTTA